jgi:hypothetical protein
MKTPILPPYPSLLVAIAGLAIALPARATPVLDLRFDDPEMHLAGMENSTKMPPGLSKPKATLASGSGGRATLQILTKLPEKAVTAQGFTTITEPAPGVRVRFDAASECSELGIGVIPEDAGKLLSIKGSNYVFRGAVDFFLRVASDGAIPKFGFWGWVGPISIPLSIQKLEDGLSAKVATTEKLLVIPGETDPRKVLSSKAETPISFEPGEVMHVALVFDTDDEGMTTVKIYLQKGTGPMQVDSGTLNAMVGPFSVSASGAPEPKARFSLKLSQMEASQSMDVFRFRIFGNAPDVFPGLE